MERRGARRLRATCATPPLPRLPVPTLSAASARTDRAIAHLYLRHICAILPSRNEHDLTGNPNTTADIDKNQGAECLYMIVMNACGDGEAKIAVFRKHHRRHRRRRCTGIPRRLGTSDFVLALGTGFRVGHSAQYERPYDIECHRPDANTAVAKDHDPFDLFHVELKAFRLVPLIYSVGRDEDAGLIVPLR